MYGYIYKKENLINHKIYIGKHKYDKPELDESYKGSGKLLIRSMNKYGEEAFTTEFIATADSLSELNALEKYYIELFDCVHPNGYNISAGGDGGDTFSNLSEEDKRERIDRQLKTRGKTTIVHKGEEHKYIKIEELENYLLLGYEQGVSDIRKEQNRQSRLKFLEEHPEWEPSNKFEKGVTPWNLGVPMREESKEKLRTCNTGKKQSAETVAKRNATLAKMRAEGWDPFKNVKEPGNKGQKGVYMWVTNGIDNIYMKTSEEIPDGYYKGRTMNNINRS